MDAELKNLKIDRGQRRSTEPSKWATRWIVIGIAIFALLGAWRMFSEKVNAAPEVQIERVKSLNAASAPQGVVLNATGYIVAAHKIQVAAKVVGKVKWIGVDKGSRVRENDIIVRLEDDEYQAQLQQAKRQLTSLQARLEEAVNGWRPEEVSQEMANVEVAQADLDNAEVPLERNRNLLRDRVISQQQTDDAQARYDSALHRVNALQKAFDLVKIGPRKEQIDSLRGQVEQAKGMVAYAETALANTVIRAPVTGTILERGVEKGEFVTTSFVGERGAKGYVVSMADLNDLEVELDISQADFARLKPDHRGVVTTDAFPDRKYEGFIQEISPEANRQKATVQVKVKIVRPDQYLRPEMNASVAFVSEEKPAVTTEAIKPVVIVPASAV